MANSDEMFHPCSDDSFFSERLAIKMLCIAIHNVTAADAKYSAINTILPKLTNKIRPQILAEIKAHQVCRSQKAFPLSEHQLIG